MLPLKTRTWKPSGSSGLLSTSCLSIILAWHPANKCCTFLHHNPVSVAWLCCAAGKQTQVWFGNNFGIRKSPFCSLQRNLFRKGSGVIKPLGKKLGTGHLQGAKTSLYRFLIVKEITNLNSGETLKIYLYNGKSWECFFKCIFITKTLKVIKNMYLYNGKFCKWSKRIFKRKSLRNYQI